jgi:alpha-1,4-N-acetylglucosaminyltransferase EXTL3
MQALLERLNKLPHLNKVVVVWNQEEAAPDNQQWPILHVPLVFIQPPTPNSLHSRFLPYKAIETEAVLSLDDDIDLKHYEIIV